MVIRVAALKDRLDQRSRLRVGSALGEQARQNRLRTSITSGASAQSQDLLGPFGIAGVVTGQSAKVVERRAATHSLYVLERGKCVSIPACQQSRDPARSQRLDLIGRIRVQRRGGSL